MYEPWVRMAAFTCAAVLILAAERAWPRRPVRAFPSRLTNFALMATNTIVVRLVSATSLVGLSLWCDVSDLGLLRLIDLPAIVEAPFAFLVLDAGMYVQHRLFHGVPWLWRVHAVHHSDTGFDVTTGVRFHPGEIVVSFALKAALVLLLGAGPWVVLVFETTLSLASLFTHGNLRLPSRFEAGVRTLIVTPEMHRTHHSVAPDEHNRNFGFFLSVWDRAFGSYRATTRDDPASMPIGLADFRSDEKQRYTALLAQPFAPR